MFNDEVIKASYQRLSKHTGEGGTRCVHEKDSFILIVYSNDDYFS